MKERMVALGFVVFALIFVAGSLALKTGTLAQPGPGFMPAAVGCALLAVAAYNAVAAYRTAPAAKGRGGGLAPGPAGVAVATLIYPPLLRSLDYLAATFLVLAALLLLLRFRSKTASVLTALATTVVSFVVFGKLLGVVLPSGLLEELILGL